MCRSHFHSRFKPALRASATAAALKAPDVRRHQVRLPLRTLRVLREGKPQLGSRSSGALGRRQQGPRRPSDREATDLPHTDWTPTDLSHADRTGAREGARLPCDPPNGGSSRSVEEGGFREGRHHGDGDKDGVIVIQSSTGTRRRWRGAAGSRPRDPSASTSNAR